MQRLFQPAVVDDHALGAESYSFFGRQLSTNTGGAGVDAFLRRGVLVIIGSLQLFDYRDRLSDSVTVVSKGGGDGARIAAERHEHQQANDACPVSRLRNGINAQSANSGPAQSREVQERAAVVQTSELGQ